MSLTCLFLAHVPGPTGLEAQQALQQEDELLQQVGRVGRQDSVTLVTLVTSPAGGFLPILTINGPWIYGWLMDDIYGWYMDCILMIYG
jgi:hypothetical protein